VRPKRTVAGALQRSHDYVPRLESRAFVERRRTSQIRRRGPFWPGRLYPDWASWARNCRGQLTPGPTGGR
jgi:hypothetical protein